MTADEIKNIIETGIADATAEVRSEDNVHFQALIVSPTFSGKNTVARHQMVYGVLGDSMGEEIHALSMRTVTPDEIKG